MRYCPEQWNSDLRIRVNIICDDAISLLELEFIFTYHIGSCDASPQGHKHKHHESDMDARSNLDLVHVPPADYKEILSHIRIALVLEKHVPPSTAL